MATQKILSTRIITKNADYAALSTSEYVLKEGEIILGKVTVTDGNITAPAFVAKVGNGGAAKDAAWMYAKAVDVYAWAKKTNLDIVDIPTLDLDATAVAPIKSAIGALEGRMDNAVDEIDALQSAVEAIKGEGEGSVAALIATALAEANGYTDAEIKALRGEDTAGKTVKGAYDAAAEAKNAAENEYTRASGVESDLDSRLQTVATAISVINGEDAGSIKKAEADAKAYADEKASAAESKAAAAEAAAKSHADNLNTAMDGKMTIAEGRITAAESKIADIEGRLANVSNVMDFRGAVEVLPASTEGYQDGDVIVVTGTGDEEADKNNTNIGKEFVVSGSKFVEFGNTDANTSAITALQGRMYTAESDIDALEGNIAAINAAIGADGLAGDIDALEGEVGTLKTTVGDANSGLVKGVADNAKAIADEATTRGEADNALDQAINDERSRAQGAEGTLGSRIDGIVSDITGKDGINDKIAANAAAIEANAGAIAANTEAIGDSTKGLTKALADETQARSAADVALGGRIDDITANYLKVSTTGEGTSAVHTIVDQDANVIIFDCGGLE